MTYVLVFAIPEGISRLQSVIEKRHKKIPRHLIFCQNKRSLVE